MTMSQEKRRIPRLSLEEPLVAKLADRGVTLLDLSTGGALVEHEFPLKAGVTTALQFVWDGEPITLTSIVVRTRLGRSTTKQGAFAYTSGLRFSNPSEPARQVVREIVADMSRKG